MKKVGVAVFAYNRPSHLRRVLIALEDLNIRNIEVFLDGPRNIQDQICNKEILFMLKTNLKIKSNIYQNQKNIGLAKSIINGLSIMSKKFDKFIVLEDDCIPRKEFFKFTYKCLKYYENDKHIDAICGYQIPEIHEAKSKTIKAYCLKNFISWGWATWSKKWNNYRNKSKKQKLTSKTLKSKIIRKIKKQSISKKNIWTFDYIKYSYTENKHFIFPNKSLIKNIGFDGSGINSKATFLFNTEYFPSNRIIIDKSLRPDEKRNIIQQNILLKRLNLFY